jgi:adenylate cyclase class IV
MSEILAKLSIDDDLEANSGEEVTKYFVSKGYFDSQKMQKTRKVFSYRDCELVIDEVDRVGLIIELECQAGEPMELVKSFLVENEWERDLEGTSYIWLRKVKGLKRHLNHLKRFETEPEWNVLAQEREYYLGISQ